MSFAKHPRLALSAIVAAFAVAAVLPLATGPASAHGVKKYRDGDRYVSRKLRRHHQHRSARHAYRRRDPAIFANQVDLSRPGGPERFFELLRQENR